jgi:lysyl-tRNA synthetase class 2
MNDEALARQAKLKELEKSGIDSFPARVSRTHTVSRLLDSFEALEKSQKNVYIVGRVRMIRTHGGMTFVTLEDGSGRMQIVLKRDVIGAENYGFFQQAVSIGDFLEVSGTVFTTKVGEKSVAVAAWRIIAKSLLPLPEKWHGLTDTEIRFRQRYLDLISNPEIKALFFTRAAVLAALRSFLAERGFVEVETPILQSIPGGANARPFATHHNALDIDLYLRVAPELHLKRLIVGGFERVYEIARCFRNEGIDHLHYPEFTQVEFYQAYADYNDFMTLTEELLPALAKAAGQDPSKVPFAKDVLDLNGPYPRLSFREAIKKFAGFDLEDYPDQKKLSVQAGKLGVVTEKNASFGTILDSIFKKTVRPNIVQPTFIIDHPIELSPLAKKRADDPRYVERFQLLLARGFELVNAFSELNDPLDQEARFREQEKYRLSGDEEAQRFDEDFVTALGHGLPPTAGLGMGIERLLMILTNQSSIKETILFPTLRPKSD